MPVPEFLALQLFFAGVWCVFGVTFPCMLDSFIPDLKSYPANALLSNPWDLWALPQKGHCGSLLTPPEVNDPKHSPANERNLVREALNSHKDLFFLHTLFLVERGHVF